jgi:predicted nucleic acid-binding protein
MTKVFLDTNIFLEYFEQRREYHAVSQLLSAVEDGKLKAVVSLGCIYTLTYLIRMGLKQKGIHRPEQTVQLRATLSTIMSIVAVGGLSQNRVTKAIKDATFNDVEDSLQYQCAIQAKCDALITINLRDYRDADTAKMEILSPTEFVEKYL